MSRFSSSFRGSSHRLNNPPRRGPKPRVTPFEDINYEYTGSIGQIHAYLMSAAEADRRIAQAQAAFHNSDPNNDDGLESRRHSLIKSLSGKPELLSSAVQVFERLASASSLLGNIPFQLVGSKVGGDVRRGDKLEGRATPVGSRRSGGSRAPRAGVSAATVSALAAAEGQEELTLTFSFRLNDIDETRGGEVFINDIVRLALFEIDSYFKDAAEYDDDDSRKLVWRLTFDVIVTPQGFTVKTQPLAPLIFEYLRNHEMRELDYQSFDTRSFFNDPNIYRAMDDDDDFADKGALVRLIRSGVDGRDMLFVGDFSDCSYPDNGSAYNSTQNGVLTAHGSAFSVIEDLEAYTLFFDALAEELSVYDAFTKELSSAIDG